MSDISTNIQVWFLRHGRTPLDYENSKYDNFIQMLCESMEPLRFSGSGPAERSNPHTQHKGFPANEFEILVLHCYAVCHSPVRGAR